LRPLFSYHMRLNARSGKDILAGDKFVKQAALNSQTHLLEFLS